MEEYPCPRLFSSVFLWISEIVNLTRERKYKYCFGFKFSSIKNKRNQEFNHVGEFCPRLYVGRLVEVRYTHDILGG